MAYQMISICYCNQVTGAMKNGKCEAEKPLGKCCGPIIQETISKTLKTKL